MRVRSLIMILSFVIVLPTVPLISNDPFTFGVSAEDMPISGYPQQDGGSDDRLFEYRSMWLEGYQIVNISEIRSIVKFARENNFNCLSPLINGHSLGVFYDSTIFPKYVEVKWDFDPLMELIKEAHKYNIHVMPWFHTLYSYPALREHPEWRDRSSYGSYSSYWMDPSNPEVRSFLVNVTRELFENYPLDGIKLDTIRYGGSSMGYTSYAQQKYLDEEWSDYSDFRRNQVTEVVEILYNNIMNIRPWTWIGADIWHSYWGWYNYVYQDSRTWAAKGIIDFVTTMSYTTSRSSFSSNLQDNLINFNVPVVSGPYVYIPGNTAHGSVPNEQAGIDLLLDQTASSQSLGALGTCNFAYKFLRAYPSYARALRDGPFSEKALCPLKKQGIPVKTSNWEFEKDHDNMGWRTTNMGQFYPQGGSWSVVKTKEPSFMSPLLNMTSVGINVIEIRMRSDMKLGNLSIYWSTARAEFLEHNRIDVELAGTRDWYLYSIHLDMSKNWQGPIRYVRIVPKFSRETNITIDSIRLTWMPYCIRSWAFLGPFYTGDEQELLDREFVEGEEQALPRIGEVISGRKWSRYSMERDMVDLGYVMDAFEDAVTYSHIYIRSTYEGVLEMRHGNSDGMKIWLNSEEVFSSRTPRRVTPDQNITFVVIKKGINTLLLKQAIYDNDISFFLRFTSPGNISVEGLEFLQDMPIMGPPKIFNQSEGWSSSSDVMVRWGKPDIDLGFDHFEIKLDGEDPIDAIGTNITLQNLSNGEHSVNIRCIDNLGLPGYGSSSLVRVDTQIPMISEPVPESPVSFEPIIEWKWNDIEVPLSGIEKYMISIEGWFPDRQNIKTVVENEEVYVSRYALDDNLDDAYRYRIIVVAESGSGLFYRVSSNQSVLLDMKAPSAPSHISLNHLNPGSRDHFLTWTDSIENTIEGIENYEVWKNIDDQGWELHMVTERTSIVIERPLGKVLHLKVRAKDHSSQYSGFSDVRSTTNSPPAPHIELLNEPIEGAPIVFITNDVMDPDGKVMMYEWYIDDLLACKESVLKITLNSGVHTVSLLVMDDLGAQAKVTESFIIPRGINERIDSTLQGWLQNSSIHDQEMPPENITHYSNRSEVKDIEEDEGENVIEFRSFLSDILLVVSASVMIILILVIFGFLFIGEMTGYGVKEFEIVRPVQQDWEQKAISDRQKFMESLMTKPLFQKMLEQDQRSKLQAAPVVVPEKLKDGVKNRSIMEYERPQKKRSVKQKQTEEWNEIYEIVEEVEEWDEFEEVFD